MAHLGVKPSIVGVAVMPVLSFVLQPIREGVRALEAKKHTGVSEEVCPLPRMDVRQGRGGFLIATEKK